MALITMEDVEKLSPVFKGKFGNALANSLMHVMGVNQLAERYGRHEDKSGPEFIHLFLNDLDVDYLVAGMENLEKLAEGPFVTISNHPYGGLDGLVLIDLIGHFREDYKVMANKILSLVKTIGGNFITVEPNFKDTPEVKAESVRGIRATLTHLKGGHPLGIFPSGAVSDLSLRERKIRDREWQESALRLIKKTEVPVVPVRFFDRNSDFFYSLGLINTTLRVARLPREVLNKGGKQIRVGIGAPISVEEQKQIKSLNDYGIHLRNSVYGMSLPRHFEPRSTINFKKMSL